MATKRTVDHRSDLSLDDLMLAVHSPWHPAAQCEASPTPLWHARVQPARLRLLWARHRTAIASAAAEAGLVEPWIVGRLAFLDIIGDGDGQETP
jgi:hypothetical protein